MEKREKFASRLGFLLISAGCAIGIGNVWRFPYITGQYGGAAFVLIYLFFLVVLGLPIMAMEFAVGRASRKSCAVSFRVLEPAGTKWHWYAWLGMAGGRVWGALFFVFMSFAALSTVIAVFENIVAFGMDLWGWSRKKAVLVNFFAILVLSLPCVLGYNVLSGFMPFGEGSAVLDLEDFLVSNTILPLGSLVYLLFCTSRYGWGWKNFVAEADEGKGIRFPKWARVYVSYVLPLIVLFIFLMGYKDKFFT